MTIVNDLAARKAYLLGQLNEVDGYQSSASRSRLLLNLWREYKQVDQQLEDACAEAEAKNSQSSVPGVSVEEGTNPAARTDSEDEADNATSNHPSPDNLAALSSGTASKAAPRKVAFHLPEASDHSSHSEGSETSSTRSSAELNRETKGQIHFDDADALHEYIMARAKQYYQEASGSDKYESSDYDGDDKPDHPVLTRHKGSQDEMEGDRTSIES